MVFVDKDVDFDFVVFFIVYLVFGYLGQKCLVGFCVVIYQDVYDEVVEKVVVLMKLLVVGNLEDFNMYMGFVIYEVFYNKVMLYIEIGKFEGKLLIGGEGDDLKGYFIQLMIFVDVDENVCLM